MLVYSGYTKVIRNDDIPDDAVLNGDDVDFKETLLQYMDEQEYDELNPSAIYFWEEYGYERIVVVQSAKWYADNSHKEELILVSPKQKAVIEDLAPFFDMLDETHYVRFHQNRVVDLDPDEFHELKEILEEHHACSIEYTQFKDYSVVRNGWVVDEYTGEVVKLED